MVSIIEGSTCLSDKDLPTTAALTKTIIQSLISKHLRSMADVL